jgi:hypothetical protein
MNASKKESPVNPLIIPIMESWVMRTIQVKMARLSVTFFFMVRFLDKMSTSGYTADVYVRV